MSTLEPTNQPVSDRELVLSQEFTNEVSALATPGMDNIYAGQLLARALKPWNNNTIKVYEPTLSERWPQILSAAETASQKEGVPLIVINFDTELAQSWRKKDRTEFYRAFCARLVDAVRPTEIGTSPKFQEFEGALRGDFSKIYLPFEAKRQTRWDTKNNVDTVIDQLSNVGANIRDIFKAMGWDESGHQLMPHLILYLSQIPILPRGVVSPLSPAEEAATTPTAEGHDLAQRLSTSLGFMQEFLFGTQGTGAYFTTILGGWLLDVLREGYADNQRWNLSIFREGAVLEELIYQDIHEIGR